MSYRQDKLSCRLQTFSEFINVQLQSIRVRVGLYHAGGPFGAENETSQADLPSETIWNNTLVWKMQVLSLALPVSHIPREARICFVIVGDSSPVHAQFDVTKSVQ